MRVRILEEPGGFSRAWTMIAMSLVFAAVLMLASCGGEGASAGDDEAGSDVSFTEFDADESGDLGEDEFYEGVYTYWDADDSGVVEEEEEFTAGVEDWYDDYDYSEYGEFNDWDVDGDGELSQDEFSESAGGTGIYDEWDADSDGVIVEEEFNEAA